MSILGGGGYNDLLSAHLHVILAQFKLDNSADVVGKPV